MHKEHLLKFEGKSWRLKEASGRLAKRSRSEYIAAVKWGSMTQPRVEVFEVAAGAFCREMNAHGRGVSIRRACALMSVARSTLHYESRLAKRDTPALGVMRELGGSVPRCGYRRIQVLLERHGHAMSADRAHRSLRLHGLHAPSKRPTV